MKPIYLCGPTAVGKSAVALEVASRVDGEIISVDSMQVYRGMDIGTAKPSRAERERVRHHLIDVADVTEGFDAARFVKLAQIAEDEIQRRGRTPIFCGGTGLYFNALLSGLGEAPASDPELRRELESMAIEHLLGELRLKDPATWEAIDRKNPRRVVRALEVIRITGKPFSEQRSEWSRAGAENFFGLEIERGELNERINLRVERMFKDGLVEEVGSLLKAGLRENRTASQALGYRQAADYLAGQGTLKETIELVKLRTRQFAKRQMTWFKRQLDCQWIEVTSDDSAAKISETLLSRCAPGPGRPQ